MRQLFAEFCRVGLRDASPWDSFVVRSCELEMRFATETTNTIAGGAEFAKKSSQIWFLNVSDEYSCSFPPGRSESTKVQNNSSYVFVFLQPLKKF